MSVVKKRKIEKISVAGRSHDTIDGFGRVKMRGAKRENANFHTFLD